MDRECLRSSGYTAGCASLLGRVLLTGNNDLVVKAHQADFRVSVQFSSHDIKGDWTGSEPKNLLDVF